MCKLLERIIRLKKKLFVSFSLVATKIDIFIYSISIVLQHSEKKVEHPTNVIKADSCYEKFVESRNSEEEGNS